MLVRPFVAVPGQRAGRPKAARRNEVSSPFQRKEATTNVTRNRPAAETSTWINALLIPSGVTRNRHRMTNTITPKTNIPIAR